MAKGRKKGYRKGNQIEIHGEVARIEVDGSRNKGHHVLVDKDYVENLTDTIHFKDGYFRISKWDDKEGKHKNIRIHRHIKGLTSDNSLVVDHLNHLKYDNRSRNLRQCTQKANTRNHQIHFINNERVEAFSIDDTPIMRISDGLYESLYLTYDSWDELFDDRDFLYYKGLDQGLSHVLQKQVYKLNVKIQNAKTDEEQNKCIQLINYLYSEHQKAIEKAKTSDDYYRMILEKNGFIYDNIPKDCPIFVTDENDSPMIIVISSGKSSYELIESGNYMFEFITNSHEGTPKIPY